MSIFLSSAYLAPVEYYTKLLDSASLYLERYDNYIKQSYRNRCTILSANGPIALSVPIEKPNSLKCLMKDIRISAHGNWQHLHWNALISAYNSTPFFEYYKDDFQPFYERKHDFLFDLNEELRELICGLLDIECNLKLTDNYISELLPNDLDFRDTIHPKKDWQLVSSCFQPEPYYQVFDQKFGFTPNLSIVDLLFNMGGEGLIVLNKSKR